MSSSICRRGDGSSSPSSHVTAGVVSHGLIAWAQQRVPVGTISMLQLGQPGLGVLWAATFLGESVQPIQLGGMAIVLSAVGTIAWRSTR